MAQLTADSLLYYSSGKIQKLSSTDTAFVSNFDVVTNVTMGASNATDKLTLAISGLSRTNADININPGASYLVKTNGGLEVSKNLLVKGTATVEGNLHVNGTLVTVDRTSVQVDDSYLALNSYNPSTTAISGGFTVNLNAVTGSISSVTAITAGIEGSGGDPDVPIRITLSAATTAIVIGDIINLHGSKTPGNDGLYVVADKEDSDTKLVLYGVGGLSVPSYLPFVKNQVTTTVSETAANVSKVNLAVLAVSDGSFIVAGSSTIDAGKLSYRYASPASISNFNNGWIKLEEITQTLNSAYSGGNTINLAASSDFKINAPTDSTFAAISLNANKASNFTVAGKLELKSTGNTSTDTTEIVSEKEANVTAPTILVNGSTSAKVTSSTAATLESTGTGTSSVTSASTVNVEAPTVSIGTNTGTASAITIGELNNSATSVTVNAGGAVAVMGKAASSFKVTDNTLTLATETTSSGTHNVAVNATGDVVLTAGANGVVSGASTLILDKSAGIKISMAGSISQGRVGYINSSGVFTTVASTDTDAEVDGVSLTANTGTGAAERLVQTIFGSRVFVEFKTGGEPVGGEVVYLSDESGKATKTVPTSKRVYRLGKALGSTLLIGPVGSQVTLYGILWKPEYITDLQ